MKRKGLIAMLDGLLAYTIAFTAAGMVTMLMMNSMAPAAKTSYSLNVWVEDLADAVGMSMVNESASPPLMWLTDTTDPDIINNLNASLQRISASKRMPILVEIGNNALFNITYAGMSVENATQVATATRFLVEEHHGTLTNKTKVLKVTIGINRQY
jgi:hypothetical protein